MPYTDEEVEKRREEIEAIRAQHAQAKIDAETVFKQYDNDITMAALDVEEERLKTELASFEAQANKAAVEASVEAQVAAVAGQPEVKAEKATTPKTAKE